MTYPLILELVSTKPCQYQSAGGLMCEQAVEVGFQREPDSPIQRLCLHHGEIVAERWGKYIDPVELNESATAQPEQNDD